jgi:hypothetical protein
MDVQCQMAMTTKAISGIWPWRTLVGGQCGNRWFGHVGEDIRCVPVLINPAQGKGFTAT